MDRRKFLCCMVCTGATALVGCVATRRRDGKGAGMLTNKTALEAEDLSYCGVDCKQCDVFKATVYGDGEARTRAHKVWEPTAQKHWGMETLDPALLICRGCRAEEKDIFKGCRHCPMRRCAKQRNLSSCGFCPGWRDCERLSYLFVDEPQAKKNLQMIAQRANEAVDGDKQ